MTESEWFPIEIPQDIVQLARYLADAVGAVQDSAEEIIARAILSERDRQREKDARIAESMPAHILQFYERPSGPPGNAYVPLTGKHVAASIRSQEP